MPTNYDTLTKPKSDDNEHDDRGGQPAQALHGIRAVPIGNVVAPPVYEQQVPPYIRLGGTIFERANNEDDEDSDDGNEGKAKDRTRQVSPATLPAPVAPSPAPIEQIKWPDEADNKKAEDDEQPEVLQPASGEPTHQLEAIEQPQPIIEQLEAEQSEYVWPTDDVDNSQPVAYPPRVHVPSPPHYPKATTTSESLDAEVLPPPPPPSASGTTGRPPSPPSYSASPNFNYPPPATPNMPASSSSSGYQRPISWNETHRPQYDNNRAVDGFARLLAAGMGIGNFIGNRRTRKMVEQNQRQATANFADIQAQQIRASEQQRRHTQALERLGYDQTSLPAAPLARGQEQAVASPVQQRNEQAPTYTSQPSPNAPAERFAESGGPMPPLPAIERSPTVPLAELLEAQLNATQMTAEQHKVQSAWHEAVVDKHGNVIEGAKEYGQGFRQSRREVIRDRSGDAAAASTTAMSGLQQQASGPPAPYPGTLPGGMTNPTLPQGMPTHTDAQHQLPSQTKQSSRPGAIFWIMLLIIIAAFFAAALI